MVRNLIIALLVSFSVLVVITLLSGIKSIYEAIAFENEMLIFSICFSIFLFLVDSFRLRISLKFLGRELRFRKCFRNVLVCSFFSLTTPFSIGGQAAQIYDLSTSGVPVVEATNIVISRSLISMFSSTGAGLIFMRHVLHNTSLGMVKIPVLIGFSVSTSLTVLIALAFFKIEYSEKILKILLLVFPKRWKERILNRFYEQVEDFKLSVRNLWINNRMVLLVDFLIWLLYMLVQPLSLYIPLKHLCRFPLGYWTLTGMYIVLNITAFYTPTPGASGGVESVFYFSLSPYVESECLLKSIVIWRIGSYYFPLILGTFYAWKMGMRKVNGS